MTNLTAGDIARRIQRPGESMQAAVDRLRNWTKEGLIKTSGSKHPGTGRRKRYSEKAALRAEILQALSDATGSPAAFLSHLTDYVEDELRQSKGPDGIFVLSRKGGTGGFEIMAWEAKDLGQAILNNKADVHVILNPSKFLDPDRWTRED